MGRPGLLSSLLLALAAVFVVATPTSGALPFPSKPVSLVINTGLSISSGLVRAVLLTEGSGTATELVGGGTGTLVNGAVWSSDANLGTTVNFSGDGDESISFGSGGLSHGNGNVSVFWGGKAPVVAALFHRAGSIAGTGVDTYHFGLNDSGTMSWVLSDVVGLDTENGTPVIAGDYYTWGIAYIEATSVSFSQYDQTTDTLAPADIKLDASSPAAVAGVSSQVGAKWDTTESWGDQLAFLYVWNRALSSGDFTTLHADPYAPFRATSTTGNGLMLRGIAWVAGPWGRRA